MPCRAPSPRATPRSTSRSPPTAIPLHCDAEFARRLGFRRETINDLLVFHTVFGKSVPDVSLNAVANLGYADVRFGVPVYPGDTLRAHTTVLGRRESRTGDSGVVWVRTTGYNQRARGGADLHPLGAGQQSRRVEPRSRRDDAPSTPESVSSDAFVIPRELNLDSFTGVTTGGRAWWEDYEPGERIHHIEGVVIEEAEQQMAARLYQNIARAHFNAHALKGTRFGKRVIYGGHVISVARALSFNGLENVRSACSPSTAVRTSNPTFAGDTLFAWTDVIESIDLGRRDAGALRLRLVGVKNSDPNTEEQPFKVADDYGRERYHENVVLDLDYTVLMPRGALSRAPHA